MTNYKISVIIPVYNAQNTIRRSIDSVIRQTIGFSNIELILYDDKSKDNSREILKQYAEKHDNIILILADKNSGYPGRGRNEGIKIASADYIMFMDSDDEYLPDMCETLYDEIIKEDADFVSCNFLNIDKIAPKINFTPIKSGRGIRKDNKIIFLDDELYDFRNVFVTIKIFKKSVILENQVKFPEDCISEDVFFIFLLLFYVKKIVYLKDYVGYIRHEQDDSISKTPNYAKIKRTMKIYSELYSFYKNNNISMDFSWLFSNPISYYLGGIYDPNFPMDNDKVSDLLEYIYSFEKEINFDGSYLDVSNKIANYFIMKKQFKLAIIYFKFMRILIRNRSFMKIYFQLKKKIAGE